MHPISRFYRTIIFICFAGILGVRLLRHSEAAVIPELNFILGVLPNFLAASGLSFLFYHLAAGQSSLKKIRFGWIATMTFFGLALWEFVQFTLWGYPVDFYDLAATVTGCVLSIILHHGLHHFYLS